MLEKWENPFVAAYGKPDPVSGGSDSAYPTWTYSASVWRRAAFSHVRSEAPRGRYRPRMDESSATPVALGDDPAVHGRRTAAVVALLIAAGLAVGLTEGGIVVTPQSAHHFAAAHSLSQGDGFSVAPGQRLTRYPPLYALFMAPLARAGVAPVSAAVAVNAFGLAFGLFAVFGLAQRIGLKHPAYVAGAFALLASNYYLLRAARPDIWMTSFSVAAAWAALVYCERATRARLWTLVALAAAATLSRYMAAFSLIPFLTLFVLWTSKERRWRRAAAFGIAASTPLALWMAHNKVATGFVTGMSRTTDRAPSADVTLLENLHGLGESSLLDSFAWYAMGARHIVFDGASLPYPGLTYLGAAGGILGLACAAGFAWRAGYRPTNRGTLLVCGCGLAYAAVLIGIWTLGNNDPINTRYTAPIYPFAALALGALAEQLKIQPEMRWARTGLAVFCFAVLVPNAFKSASLLLSEPPSKDMLEVTSRRGQHVNWQTSLEWERR